MNASELSVIILAGGRSTRMGRDKAMIEIAGVPLIRRIYDVVSSVGLGRVHVVTPWPEQYQHALPASCKFILEQQPHQGPLIAFAQALAEINTSWVLLLACDLPNLSAPAIESWIDSLPAIDSQSIAYLPRHASKGWEPLCGFYRQICGKSAIEYIDRGGQSFQGWLKMHAVTELVIADPLWLVNCNTPADLAAITQNICTIVGLNT